MHLHYNVIWKVITIIHLEKLQFKENEGKLVIQCIIKKVIDWCE